jgi:hypothetical protein
MSELQEIQQLFSAAASAIETRYIQQSQQPGEVSPMQLADALHKLFQAFEVLDEKNGANATLPYNDPSELGEHGMLLAADLVRWAERLQLPQAKSDIEKIAVGIALWVARHGGEIRELETVVNGFAASANTTTSDEALRALFRATKAVLEHAAPSIKADLDQANPGRPWRVLNFNFAIVATRIQDAQLMHEAFDTLSRNLPQDAPAFFEEGLKQSDKPVYGPVVKNLMQEYFARWTVRH